MSSLSVAENTTNAPPWYRETTHSTNGPSKLTIARPISAPYSNCSRRSDSGEPSKPDRLASTTTGRQPLAALIARATFFDDSGNSVPADHCAGPSAGVVPWRGSGRDSMPIIVTAWPPSRASYTTAISASAISGHRSSGSWSWSIVAPISVRMSNGFLRSGLAVSEKMSPTVRKSTPSTTCGDRAHVAVGRIRRGGPPRPPLAGCPVGQLVVVEEHVARRGQARRPVLGLAVRAHHPAVAADAEVVLGGHPAGVVDRLLAGQHHRAVRRHHEDAPRVHEHRRLGVPVRLGADVDAGDDDVDLAALLGVLDEAAQHAGHPVEVLAAGVHGDLGAGRQGEPLDRHVHRGGQVDRRQHPPALGLGDRPHRPGRVAEHGDPRDALAGSARSACCTTPTTTPARFWPGGRSTGTSRPSPSRSCSTNVPRSPRSSGTSSYGYTRPRRRVWMSLRV